MTVYVDDMAARYRGMVMCHMAADSDAELHGMADAIGIKRRWHQGDHYDICRSKRALAIAAGAREISQREMARMIVGRRKGMRALAGRYLAGDNETGDAAR